MVKRNSNDAAPNGNPDTPIPEGLLYTREQLQTGMKPGLRPLIPAWHLVDGVIKLTYWHAVKYYSHTLMYAEQARLSCVLAEARKWVEDYHHFRNRRLEEVLKWLLDAYPPFIQDIDKRFPQHRPWEMVRNRTSECPFPPILEEVGHGVVTPHLLTENDAPIKPYVMLSADKMLQREWLTGIMLGESEPFFAYLHAVKTELAEGFEHLRELMSKGGGDVRRLEPMSNTVKMMHNDVADYLAKYS